MAQTTRVAVARQSLQALEQANHVRSARAQLKRRVKAGGVAAADVVLTSPWQTRSMSVGQLLMSQRGWGRVRTRRLLLSLAVPENKQIATLSERQRLAIAAVLRRRVLVMPSPRRDDLPVDPPEEVSMPGVQSRDFESPDETRAPDKTKVDIVRMDGTTVGRFAFEPGWRWSDCIKPVAGTESCQARHVGVVQSGRIAVKHEDGTELELGPGDAYIIEPGHDAWVVGDERFVGFEFESKSAEEYAKG